MQLFYVLLVLLLVARLCAEIAERLRQPALVGELVAGVALGFIAQRYTDVFPVLAALPENEVFSAVIDLSIFFLMLLAGIELHPRRLAEASRNALIVALGGMALPLVLGFSLGWLFLPDSALKLAQSLFLATALAITAVPVSVKILMDLDQLDSKIGRTIVSAAVFDDVLSLVLLAILTAIIKSGSLPGFSTIGILVVKVIVYFFIAVAIGRYIFPWLGRKLKVTHAEEFEFSVLLVGAFAYALLAEALGMHFILGPFLAGLFFVRSTVKPKVYESIRSSLETCTIGFFAPVFFASIGLHLQLGAITEIPIFVMLIVLAAFLGKLIGAGLPAWLVGIAPRESLVIGTAMSARGAVELIVASIALQAGLFRQPAPAPPEVAYLFSATVIMALATTIVAPLIMRQLISRK